MPQFSFAQFRDTFAEAAEKTNADASVVEAIRNAVPAWSLAQSGMDSLDQVDVVMQAEELLEPHLGKDAAAIPNEITEKATSLGQLYELWCGLNGIATTF